MSSADALHWRLAEAILFASAEPVAERDLAQRLPEGADVRAVLHDLQAHYRDRGVALVRVGKHWALRTAPDLGPFLSRERQVQRKLSRAAIEVLAIIAYHQPITRAEIESIRGVQLGKGTLDTLFEQGWIRPKGKKATPGRPATWGTTAGFLDHFGLESLDDLPGAADLKSAGLLNARPAIQAYGAPGSEESLAAENADKGVDKGAGMDAEQIRSRGGS